MNRDKLYASFRIFCFNLFLIGIILSILSFFSILNVDIIINADFVLALGLLFGLFFIILGDKLGKNHGRGYDLLFELSPYVFLIFLVFIALNQFLHWQFIDERIVRLTIISVAFGAITFWRNRDRVENEIEEEKAKEENAEASRAMEFEWKFPKIS
ncbi:MAG: hypothetical protein AABX66_00240, partial [Nanoarchaeota archaeon]